MVERPAGINGGGQAVVCTTTASQVGAANASQVGAAGAGQIGAQHETHSSLGGITYPICDTDAAKDDSDSESGYDGFSTRPSYQITRQDIEDFLRTLAVTPQQVAEAAAVQQRTPEWFRWREGRLSASNFGAAAGHNPYKTPGELAVDMLWPTPIEGEALEYGATMESTAFRVVALRVGEHLRTTLGYQSCWIEETGTLICLEHPWLSVSSDGLLYATAGPAQPEREMLRGTIELKCPIRKAFYDKTPHYYYDQFMGAAALLGVDFVVFGVYEPEATQINYYTFDRDYWRQMLFPRLYRFYMEVYAPRAILKKRGLLEPGCLDVAPLVPRAVIVPPSETTTTTTKSAKRATCQHRAKPAPSAQAASGDAMDM
jgi:hypothetical protein